MGIFVDLIIVLIIGLCIFNGYRKGLARCILKLVTSIIALFIAILLFRPFVNFVVNNTIIDENIQLSLEKVMNNGIEERKDENNNDLVKEDSGIPKPIAEYLNSNLKNTAKQKQEEAVVSVARSAAILIVEIACFILIYVIVKIILKILTILIDVVSKLPIIRQFNEVGGFLYGIVEGVVIILLIMTGVAIVTPLTGAYEVATIILQSHLGAFFYNNNIILNLIF
jgi:uncharacterized membrane protein required for colicin V production